ncbi:Small ubiquitin-related modifier [Trichinella spiralis]|uniref:Small ubiquitin-related modifier n=1 Tax=Trichinella spiralis TaxID=6334 RepID=A0ABR3KJS3_TRISP
MDMPLIKLMKAYSERTGIGLGSLRFVFDGSRLDDTKTPKELNMEDNDMIDVYQQQHGGIFMVILRIQTHQQNIVVQIPAKSVIQFVNFMHTHNYYYLRRKKSQNKYKHLVEQMAIEREKSIHSSDWKISLKSNKSQASKLSTIKEPID